MKSKKFGNKFDNYPLKILIRLIYASWNLLDFF